MPKGNLIIKLDAGNVAQRMIDQMALCDIDQSLAMDIIRAVADDPGALRALRELLRGVETLKSHADECSIVFSRPDYFGRELVPVIVDLHPDSNIEEIDKATFTMRRTDGGGKIVFDEEGGNYA